MLFRLFRCMALIGATDELLIYAIGVPLNSIGKIDLACGSCVLGFGRLGGLLWAFGLLDVWSAVGIFLVCYQDVLLLVGCWRALNWLLLGFWWASGDVYVHRLFSCFSGLGGFLLCWWFLMSAFVWLFIGVRW